MRHFVAVVASLVVLLSVQGAVPVRAVPAITPEHLLVALGTQEMPQVLPNPGNWWPRFPEFNVGLGDRAPGLRFYVAQTYERVGGGIKGSAETVIILYDDDTHAAQDFAGRIPENNDRNSVLMDGPRVGTRSRYFTRVADSVKAHPYETTVRFHLGPMVARVAVFSPTGYQSPAVMAGYAAPIERGIRQLLNGRLRPTPLTRQIAALLPPAAAAAAVGPVLGSAMVPIEAWALVDLLGNPPRVRDTLRAGGVAALGMRRYALAADRAHVVEVTVLPFGSEDAARSWWREFAEDARTEKARVLATGRVNGMAAFRYNTDADVYEFQFPKGRVVGDVSCFAPFGTTSPACEAPVRRLAERWFAALPTR